MERGVQGKFERLGDKLAGLRRVKKEVVKVIKRLRELE